MRIEPKIGEIITVENVKYITKLTINPEPQCNQCHLLNKPCRDISCIPFFRKDGQAVIFKEVKEMEVKIQIPDNCELIKDGNTYIVKEKKQEPPKSWEEFCERYPTQKREAYIDLVGQVREIAYNCTPSRPRNGKNFCISKEEVEAFLALMQLRQLRKAWIGDWERDYEHFVYCIINCEDSLVRSSHLYANSPLSFPTEEMAKEFHECFKDLCETAKRFL